MNEPSPRRRRFAAAIFYVLLPLWTWKLLDPFPLPVELEEWFYGWKIIKVVLAKLLHVTMYAALTYLAGHLLPLRRPVFTFALSLLMLHGVVTEILQTFVPNRSGLATDVLIDWLGILIGMAIGRSQWRIIWLKSER